MADSDKSDKSPAARPTVKGAGTPRTTSAPGRTAAEETALRPSATPAAARPAATKAPGAPGQPVRPTAAARKPTPTRPATPARPASAPEDRTEQTLVSQTPVSDRGGEASGSAGVYGTGTTEQDGAASDQAHHGSITSGRARGSARRPRRARLRLTRIDPLSVMKASFLLSVAFGVVTFVAVLITWSVLGAAGVWDSVNDTVGTIVSSGENASSFDIRDYVGMGRVLGFTLIVAVVDVVLLTAIATLTAFLYNMAASLLGGVEVTLSEDDH